MSHTPVAVACSVLVMTSCAADRGGSDGALGSTSLPAPGSTSAPGAGSDTESAGSDAGLGSDDGGDDSIRLDVGDPGGPGPGCDCAPDTDLIHLLSGSAFGPDAQVWTFDPVTLAFAQVGTLDCFTGNSLASTYAMAVDRDGIAWVMFDDGSIGTAPIDDPANCTDPGYVAQNGWLNLGLSFVSGSAPTCETLFGHDFSGLGPWSEGNGVGRVGRMNAATLAMELVGTTDFDGADLAGTGDGRLFLFGGLDPAKIVEIDPGDGSVLQTTTVPGFALTTGFAFTFWGGDFYLFTESGGPGSNSQINVLDFDDSDGNGRVLTRLPVDAPLRVVGASSSTCAPIEPVG